MSQTAAHDHTQVLGAWDFELVAGPYDGRTDAPLWQGEELLFSVLPQHSILKYSPSSGTISEFRRHIPRLTGLAVAPNGDLYGCQSGARRVVRFNRDGSTSPMDNIFGGHMHNHPDDLAIDQKGRIWFSDPYDPVRARGVQIHGPLDHASVLRLEQNSSREWQLVRVTRDTHCPRGVLLSHDGSILYVSEDNENPELPRELRAYSIGEDGSVRDFAVLHTFGSDFHGVHAGIQGMCLDSQGNIIACAGSPISGPGPLLYVFSPSGQILHTRRLPDGVPTNCTFGDQDLSSIYVTTVEGHLYRIKNTGMHGIES